MGSGSSGKLSGSGSGSWGVIPDLPASTQFKQIGTPRSNSGVSLSQNLQVAMFHADVVLGGSGLGCLSVDDADVPSFRCSAHFKQIGVPFEYNNVSALQ
jgi:hypothetical protein